MEIHIHIHNHPDNVTAKKLDSIVHSIQIIKNQLNNVLMNQEELAQKLRDLKAQADKAKAEILAKIEALKSTLGETTPEVDAALADLVSAVQNVDDIVPDETTGS